jgi:beta-lactamase regulating signal transducer with metallopeptidase domain
VLAEVAALARAAGLRRAPRVSVVDGLAVPVATARGEICLPARALASLAPEELRAVLAHEVAHLRRGDPRWLWAFALVGDLCWVQPLHRVALAAFADGSELLCDAWAAEATGRPRALARSLAAVGAWALAADGGGAPPATAAAMARRRSPLARRVERLLAPAAARPAASRWLARGVVAVAVAAIAGAAWAAPRLVPAGAPRLVLLEKTAVDLQSPR